MYSSVAWLILIAFRGLSPSSPYLFSFGSHSVQASLMLRGSFQSLPGKLAYISGFMGLPWFHCYVNTGNLTPLPTSFLLFSTDTLGPHFIAKGLASVCCSDSYLSANMYPPYPNVCCLLNNFLYWTVNSRLQCSWVKGFFWTIECKSK